MKKGILILIDTLYPSGAEKVAVNIALKLKESKEYYPYLCATRVGGELEYTLKKNNIEYIVLRRNQKYEIHKFYPLIQLIRSRNIKIIHAHKLGTNLWGGLIGYIMGIPVVSHFHAHHKSVECGTSLIATKMINRLSNRIISISDFERTRLIKEEGINPLKIVTISNGIDSNAYRTEPDWELKKQLGLKTESPIIGCVAAFREQKNHEFLMRVAKEIITRKNDIYFILVGDGVTRSKIENMAAEFKIKDNCIFTGLRNDVPNMISIFDVSILSSHWEGLPISVLEYMASGKPVVCTDVSGLSELVEDNVNGFLVPQDDYTTFSDKIKLLLNDKELASNMGKNGFATVKEKFSEEMMMYKIITMYDDILLNKKLE